MIYMVLHLSQHLQVFLQQLYILPLRRVVDARMSMADLRFLYFFFLHMRQVTVSRRRIADPVHA
jgi:hypothetical protein